MGRSVFSEIMPQFRCYRLPGLFTLRVPKETAGKHFDGLQMLTSLLAPKGSRSAKPLVEEVNTGESEPSMFLNDSRSADAHLML